MPNVVSQLVALGLLSNAPTIEVETLGEGRHVLTLSSPAALSESAAQAALLESALAACGTQFPQFDRYDFKSKRKLNSPDVDRDDEFQFVQQISCVAPSPPALLRAPAPALSAAQQTQLEQQVLAQTELYFQALENGRAEDANRMFIPSMQEPPGSARHASIAQFSATAGKRLRTDIWKTTVYVNPANAPAPGIYVATDFELSYESVLYRCGYLMWTQDPSGELKISREEVSEMQADVGATIPGAQLAELRRQARCAP